MNPLFSLFTQQPQQMPTPNQNLLSQFNAFRSAFQGDPQAKVQELLNTGQMSQQQFNQLSEMARTFQQFLK